MPSPSRRGDWYGTSMLEEWLAESSNLLENGEASVTPARYGTTSSRTSSMRISKDGIRGASYLSSGRALGRVTGFLTYY